MSRSKKEKIVQDNIILRIIKNPFTSFIFEMIAFILSIISFLSYKSDWMLLVIYFCPFVLCGILLINNFNLHSKNQALKKEKEKSIDFTYANNLREIMAKLKNELNNISLSYVNFCESLDSENSNSEEVNCSEVYEKQLQEHYKNINKNSHSVFRTVVKSVKDMIERALDAEGVEISVCIKQLDKCFHKRSNSIPSDLKVFAVYRDESSYKNGREIGHLYTVNGNSTFRSCIMNNKSREACFIENNIQKAINKQTYQCENEDAVLANKIYNAVMVVPICIKIQSDWYYYGFLCIDAYTDMNEIFTKKLLPILQFFAEILAIFYKDVTTYFPTIFDHLNHEVSEEYIDEQ